MTFTLWDGFACFGVSVAGVVVLTLFEKAIERIRGT
jgi:hypothetical protein